MSEQPGGDWWGAPPTVEYCYRHPNVRTAVHCTRCGRPICPDCMIPAPVGHQCPQCVEDARREFRRGSVRRVQPVRAGGLTATKALLLALLAVFAVEVALGGPNAFLAGPPERTLIRLGALQPFLIANGQYWRLFSAIFLHAGLLHIGFNAYALWIFGAFTESVLGRTRFLVIFFVTGFAASATSYAFGPVQTVGVGASGAIFGVFGAFIAYNFRRRHLPQAQAQLRWALTLIVLNALLAFGFPGIDWRAHVGGLVSGFLAGLAAEGMGDRRTRMLISVAGFAALVVAAVALVVWRTDQIQALPFFAQGVRFFGSG